MLGDSPGKAYGKASHTVQEGQVECQAVALKGHRAILFPLGTVQTEKGLGPRIKSGWLAFGPQFAVTLVPVVTSLGRVNSFPEEASRILSRANAIKCEILLALPIKVCSHGNQKDLAYFGCS